MSAFCYKFSVSLRIYYIVDISTAKLRTVDSLGVALEFVLDMSSKTEIARDILLNFP